MATPGLAIGRHIGLANDATLTPYAIVGVSFLANDVGPPACI